MEDDVNSDKSILNCPSSGTLDHELDGQSTPGGPNFAATPATPMLSVPTFGGPTIANERREPDQALPKLDERPKNKVSQQGPFFS